MMLVNKHLDPVIGIDVHVVIIPPVPVVPIPHPHVGFILDLKELSNGAKAVITSMATSFVMDKTTEFIADNPELVEKAANTLESTGALGALSKAGDLAAKANVVKEQVKSNPLVGAALKLQALKNKIQSGGQGGSSNRPILVNNMMRATVGTRTRHVPGLHFPLGTGFAAPDPSPSKDSQSFMGSKTVIANADYLSFMALPAMSCWSVGLPPPKAGGNHTSRSHLSLPTSTMLPIPMGREVLVGGAPALNALALALSLFKAFRGSALARKLADKLKLKSGFLRCVVLKAEPVDATSGEVVVEQNDFTVQGRLPLVWDRYYAGNRSQRGILGAGWRTLADSQLTLMCHDGAIGAHLCLPEYETAFDIIPLEEGREHQIYDWQQGNTLYRQGDDLLVSTRDGLCYHFPLPKNWQTVLGQLTESTPVTLTINGYSDADSNGWQFLRDTRNRLVKLVEYHHYGETGRYLSFYYGQWQQEAELYPYQGDIGECLVNVIVHHGTEQHVLAGYHYNFSRQMTAVTNSLNYPYRFDYDERQQMVSHTDRNGLTFYYAYDDFSDGVRRVIRAWGDGGLFDYHFEYNLVTCETTFIDSLNNRNVLQYDERGYPISEINAAGEVTAWQYDSSGRCSVEIDAMGREQRFEYDSASNLQARVFPDRSKVSTQYNELGKPVVITDPSGGQWQQH